MPNNKKIIPDATKYDYMSTAFMRQQINGQISENPTYNNSQISVPSFVKTAIITAIIEPAEEVGVKGQRFVEYQAEEVVQYFDETDGDMSWKKVSELTDNALGPDSGGLWSGGSLYEPFSNTFDYLIAFLNVKYQVGDIVTVSMLDNAYQPVELDSAINQIKSKDLGIPLHNWGQRWFITGGLPKDGSATWEYAVSDDRTKVEILQNKGTIVFTTAALTTAILCASCDQVDGLNVFKTGQQIRFRSRTGSNVEFTADATSGTVSFYFSMAVRSAQATFGEAGFTTLDQPFTTAAPGGGSSIEGGTYTIDGYQEARAGAQNTSTITGQPFDKNDYDIWLKVSLVDYLAHESVSTPGKFLVYDITPRLSKVLFLGDGYSFLDAETLTPSQFVGDCGIDITSTGTGTTTTLTFSIDAADIAGAGLVGGTGTSTCVLDIGAGCGITVNADDIEVDRDALTGDGLINGTGTCELAIGAGCGITVNAEDIEVDNTALAGAGLVPNTATCALDVGEGTYIDVDVNNVDVNIIALAAAMAGDCLTPDGAGGIDLDIVAGAGLTQTGCTLNVTATGGGGTTYTEGCGINITTGDVIEVDSQFSIVCDTSTGKIELENDVAAPGDNFHYATDNSGSKAWIDMSTYAGNGLRWDIVNKNYTLNISQLAANPVDIENDYIPFGTSLIATNEKALFTDFLKAVDGFDSASTSSNEPQIIVTDKNTHAIKWISGDKTKTQVLGHVNGVWQLIDTNTC